VLSADWVHSFVREVDRAEATQLGQPSQGVAPLSPEATEGQDTPGWLGHSPPQPEGGGGQGEWVLPCQKGFGSPGLPDSQVYCMFHWHTGWDLAGGTVRLQG